jgi:NTP pyrophosphatase (non-canonical NTP hydrolase)
MSENITCPYCGSADYTGAGFGGDDTLICNSCGKIFIGVNAEMIASPEAHGFGVVAKNATTFERPLPCVRDEHGEIRKQTARQLLSKVNEELDELKDCIFSVMNLDDLPDDMPTGIYVPIAEEAADTITAITTLLEAMGIDAEMRNEAQRKVNAKNLERGRL